MLVYKIKYLEQLEGDFYDFINFPFDNQNFRLKFVISEFKFNNKYYRFDFYRTKDNMISYKKKVDRLAEFDIDFNKTNILTISDHYPA